MSLVLHTTSRLLLGRNEFFLASASLVLSFLFGVYCSKGIPEEKNIKIYENGFEFTFSTERSHKKKDTFLYFEKIKDMTHVEGLAKEVLRVRKKSSNLLPEDYIIYSDPCADEILRLFLEFKKKRNSET